MRARAEGTVNPNMATGEIEVLATSVKVLNTSVTPPFSIEDGIETDETARMKWRYMDLRRPEMFNAIKLRHTVAQAMRSALNDRGFIEVRPLFSRTPLPRAHVTTLFLLVRTRVNSTRFRRARSSSSRC